MHKIILKIIPVFFFWGIFVFVVLQVPYPESLTQANFNQLVPFFGSLFLALLVTFGIFLKNIFLSLFASLGLILSLILQALNSLNLVTGVLILISLGLLFSYFKKTKRETGGIRGIKGIRRIRGIRKR